ncbi:biotin transporter BioY [Paenibacillus naphthalenovorans]|uniref:biotin transporter BioY n=1 Tax=Paenibacillus naphthalenovorans TaxID=162209 RepID=UPI00088BAC14|nr:biotin transporter BioY [Paenibacillus naphthalenovorans]GCL70205.1 biotin transporter BioY [Paenibacillus naphthalenovorans]SDH88924.1 biotin transport system substrate-specific component [Paenibacillus naphthalenovorans]
MAKTLTLRGVAFSALFAALVVVFGYVSIPLGFTPVPITLQTLAVMLAGGLLGARYGFFSMMIVVVLAALGFPLLQGKGGLPAILGPTGGYVIMWPFAALLIGLLVSKVRSSGWPGYVLVFLIMEGFGSLLLYVTGVPWLAHAAGFSMNKAIALGFYPYLIGDVIKALAATAITVSLRQVFPQARLTGHGHGAVRQSLPK